MENFYNQNNDYFLKNQQMQQILHYGAIITISVDLEKEDKSSFIFCEGFFNTKNISIQNFSKSTEDNSGSLFKIIPSFKYAIQNNIIRDFLYSYKSNGNFFFLQKIKLLSIALYFIKYLKL